MLYRPSPGTVLLQARADYADHLRRLGYDKARVADGWADLSEQDREVYIRRAERRLIAELGGPGDELLYQLTAPWALPILNGLARFFDGLSERITRSRAERRGVDRDD